MANSFHRLTIEDILPETADAYSLFLRIPPNLSDTFAYQAGQYVTIRLTDQGEELHRAYSLGSSPATDDLLRLTIKEVPDGRVSSLLRQQLTVGDELDLMPPNGRFALYPQPEAHHHYILIGAGSGITPLFSILRTALITEPRSQVSLWYGSRNRASIIYREELQALSQAYPDRLQVVHFLSQAEDDWPGYRGRLDSERMYDLVSEVFMTSEGHKQYYLCGPLGLMQAAEAALDQHAVNFANVHKEYYEAPVPSAEEEPEPSSASAESVGQVLVGEKAEALLPYQAESRQVSVVLNGETHELTVNPDQPILQAAIDAKLDPPYSCLSGVCSSCQARVEQGAVMMRVALGLGPEDLADQQVLSCQALPLTDGVVLRFPD